MNAAAATVLERWQVCGDARVDSISLSRPRPATTASTRAVAELARHAWRWVASAMKRLAARREPQTPQELMAYASSIEQTMPNQAAELRFIVMRQADLLD